MHGSGRGKEQGNNKSSARGAASNMYRGDRAAAKRGGLTGRKTAPITVATAVAPRRRARSARRPRARQASPP
ncbi:hypothetical protein BMAJHU_C1132, partial [Burkholderia mallei JHU]